MEQKRSKKAAKIARTASDTAAVTIGGVIRLFVKAVSTALLIILLTAMLFSCVFAYYVKTSLSKGPDISLDDFALARSTTLYSQDPTGGWIEIATLEGDEDREWVDLNNIPLYLQHAAVAIEDKRFYKHKGVDWYRTVGAFANMFLSMRDNFGGSTITQQLIKNLTHQDDITVQRKLSEIFNALDFEQSYDKDEIMEWYLNAIFFGEKKYGVQTAAKLYFDKNVWELSLAECASLIGITNNPSIFSPYIDEDKNRERQLDILWQMYEQGWIDQEEYSQAKDEQLVFQRAKGAAVTTKINSYYTDAVIRDVMKCLQEEKGYSELAARTLLYSGGLQIYTCMNKQIQDIVDYIYQNPDNIPKAYGTPSQPLESAMVIVDPYTGGIAALIGGVGEKEVNLGHCLATIALRPPGSSIKPLSVYTPALDLGLITQYTKVNDSKDIVLSPAAGGWYPANSGGYDDIITIRYGVQWSKNTVAAQVLDKIGVNTSYDYMTQRLGFVSLTQQNRADIQYAALALGQPPKGVTVREMAQGYTAIANNGIFTYSRTFDRIEDAKHNVIVDNRPVTITAFKANAAWNMTDMLQNAASYGTGSEAYLGFMNVAGKTGTTTSNFDRYFVGFTPYYVGAVWTGYDMPEYMNFGGRNPAAIIWHDVMLRVHQELGLENKPFPTPTIGGDTNIFADSLKVSPSPEPSEAVSPTPSEAASPALPSSGITIPSPAQSLSPSSQLPGASPNNPQNSNTPQSPIVNSPIIPIAPTAPPPATMPVYAPTETLPLAG